MDNIEDSKMHHNVALWERHFVERSKQIIAPSVRIAVRAKPSCYTYNGDTVLEKG